MSAEQTESVRASLREASGGSVILAGEVGYEQACRGWNTAVELRPAAVASPADPEELAAVLAAAHGAGLRVAAHTTGHGAGPLDGVAMSEVLLVRMGDLAGVDVDPVARTARVGAGARWGEVVAAASAHGLTALHGSSPTVGVVGYLLGGGVSFYARAHGFARDSLRSLDLLTPDGQSLHVSASSNADLFALVRRGLGGHLGVVTQATIDLLPYSEVFAGMLLWDGSEACRVGRAWASWTARAPRTITTTFRLMVFPDLPALPPFLRGRQVVIIDGVALPTGVGTDAHVDEAELIAELRALDPEIDTFARVGSGTVPSLHLDPVDPTPVVSDHRLLGALPEEAIDAFLDAAADAVLVSAELRHLGGALADPDRATPLDAAYAVFTLAVAPAADARANAETRTRAVAASVDRWAVDRLLATFAEHPAPPQALHGVPARHIHTLLPAHADSMFPHHRL